MFLGPLKPRTVTILLGARGLKHSPLVAAQLADIALGPPPTTTDLQLDPLTARIVRMAEQLNLMFRLTWTGLVFSIMTPPPLARWELPLLAQDEQRQVTHPLARRALITWNIGATFVVKCPAHIATLLMFYSPVTQGLEKFTPPVLCRAVLLRPVVKAPLTLMTCPK